MFSVLSNPTYAKLFTAQILAVLGTGLMTIALGLLAFDLAGENAGVVMGLALTIKMVAYVGIGPIANAVVDRLPRKAVLIGADIIRASIALALPFVDAIWQVYVLIFVLQTASATFTPAFQATIPQVLPDERDYTKALSLSRLAVDMESLLSPALAGLLLLVMSFHWLFAGTVFGFLISALLISNAALPRRIRSAENRSFGDRVTRGMRIYLATPRLRGLLALNLAVASISAYVLVNTVVVARTLYGRSDTDVTLLFAAFGIGSMIVAFTLPRILERLSDRAVMTTTSLSGALVLLGAGLWLLVADLLPWAALMAVWTLCGAFYSATLTPTGRLIKRSAQSEDLSSVFAAQFALSHGCWLFTYPLAGWIGAAYGQSSAMIVLGVLAIIGAGLARVLWPAKDPEELAHEHPDLPENHPHLEGKPTDQHSHAFVIDDLHPSWPQKR